MTTQLGLFLTPDAAALPALRSTPPSAPGSTSSASRAPVPEAAEGAGRDPASDTFVLAPEGDIDQQIERFALGIAPEVRD